MGQDGNMLKDSPQEIELFNEKGEIRKYKKGKRIVDLSHKLKLMEYSLNPELKKTIQSLEKINLGFMKEYKKIETCGFMDDNLKQ